MSAAESVSEEEGSISRSHKSSVVIIPPENVWDQIQEIRREHDKVYERWMPHINMLYPFLSDTSEGKVFQEAASKLNASFSSFPSFKVTFSQNSFRYFKHKKSGTLWLKPEIVGDETHTGEACAMGNSLGVENLEDYANPHPRIIQLQQNLQDLYPKCNDVSTISDRGFMPHLSLGQFTARDVKKYAEKFMKDWTDITFDVKDFYLISREDFHDPFHIRQVIKLCE